MVGKRRGRWEARQVRQLKERIKLSPCKTGNSYTRPEPSSQSAALESTLLLGTLGRRRCRHLNPPQTNGQLRSINAGSRLCKDPSKPQQSAAEVLSASLLLATLISPRWRFHPTRHLSAHIGISCTRDTMASGGPAERGVQARLEWHGELGAGSRGAPWVAPRAPGRRAADRACPPTPGKPEARLMELPSRRSQPHPTQPEPELESMELARRRRGTAQRDTAQLGL